MVSAETHRVQALREEHRTLEGRIAEETTRPLPNGNAITEMKRRKLRIKDELVHLERVSDKV